MGGRETRHGAVACLVTLTTLALQHRAASGAQIRRPSRSGIPFTVFVTGKWASDAPEIKEIEGNMHVKSAQRNMGQQIAEMRYAKWVPIGSKIHYYVDEEMAESAREISLMLRQDGVTQNAFQAFSNLRPAAYRADLWRYMALWAYGGIYLDANIQLKAHLRQWIDFQSDKLVLVNDAHAPICGYWNAMMAAPKKNRYLALLIKFVVKRIEMHQYGANPIDITGPTAVCRAFRTMNRAQYNLFKKKGMRCDLKKIGDPARVMNHGRLMAVKDESLHSKGNDTHYDPMWHEHRVFCDQLSKPESWSGMCGSEDHKRAKAVDGTEAREGVEAGGGAETEGGPGAGA